MAAWQAITHPCSYLGTTLYPESLSASSGPQRLAIPTQAAEKMPGGGWNGGHWSPNLNQGASGYHGPDRTPPFHEWKHLPIDEQIQRAREWRAQNTTSLQLPARPGSFSAPAPISTFSPTPARSSSPHALQSRAPRPGPVTVAPELSTAPDPDHQLRAQRELTFGGHRTPGQTSATQQFDHDQTLNGQASAPWYPGVPQGAPNQSITTPGPRLDPTTAAETDTFAPVAVHPAGVPQQGRSERESSFDEDYKRWESQVVHGQPPVPTSHILVPRVPAPGPPTTPFFVSSPPATTRNDPHTIASQTPTSHPDSSIPLRAFEGLTVQPESQPALPETRSPGTAHSVPSAVQEPRTEDQISSLEALNHPLARDRLSEPGETGAAIESNPVHPEVGDEPSGSTTEFGTASDDPAVQSAIRDVEAQIEELEFQPLTAPVKEPPPPPSDSEAVSKKTAKNRAKKARQKENRKAKKAAAAAEEPEDHTDPDKMKDDGKRKATEDPASPAAAKRVKHDDSAEPPPKPKMAVIPFPEKVCLESDASLRVTEPMLTLGSACSTRGACR